MIPDHISALIREFNDARIPAISEERPLAAGDIRCVNSGSLDRLVLILKIDVQSESAQVVLVHGFPEFATEFDLILRSGNIAMPFDIVVQTDLRSVVLLPSIGRFVGAVEEPLVEAAIQGSGSLGLESKASWGPGLLGPLDARWDFKIAEGEVMRSIASPAVLALLDEESRWGFDLENIYEAVQESVDDEGELAAAMSYLLALDGESYVMTPDELVSLYDKGLLDESTWLNALGVLGENFYNAVLIPLFEAAISRNSNSYNAPEVYVRAAELRELQTT